MKQFVWLILCVLAFSSCKKYRLSQPAYLNFGWKYVNQNESSKTKITGMEFYLTDFGVNGIRKEGEPIDMTKDFTDDLVSFNGDGAIGIGMDVPVGEYTSFNLSMNIPKKAPGLVLKGTYNTGTEIIPMRIEWTDAKSLVFKAIAEFELKKKKTYQVNMNLDVEELFENVSEDKWDSASFSNENGVTTLVIRSDNSGGNPLLFSLIDASIADAIYLTVP